MTISQRIQFSFSALKQSMQSLSHPVQPESSTTNKKFLHRLQFSVKRMPLALQLTGWFILLSLIPFLVFAFYVRNEVNTRIVAGDMRTNLEIVRLEASHFSSTDDKTQMKLSMFAATTKEDVGIINKELVYVVHTDSAKIGTSAAADFPAEILTKSFSGKAGFSFQPNQGRPFAYAPVPDSEFVVLASKKSLEIHALADLEWEYYATIGGAVLLVSTLAGVIIWVMVTIPLRKLTSFAGSIQAGEQAAKVGSDSMSGEVKVLAAAFNEMTERIQSAYSKLQENEILYRGLFEGVPIGLYRTTPNGRLVDANSALVQMLRYPDRESLLRAKSSDMYVAPGVRQVWQRQVEQDGVVAGFEMQLRRKDGTTFWARETARIRRDAQGSPAYYEGSLEDITAEKTALLTIQESERRFRSLSDASFEGIAVTQDGKVLDVNTRMAAMLGYSIQEMIGMSVSAFVAPESLESVLAHLASGSEDPYEHLAKHRDGHSFPVEIHARSLPSNGGFRRVTAIRDITERKRSEESLRQSEARFRSLFESASDAIFVMNETAFLQCNPKTLEMFGCRREQIIGYSPLDFSPDLQPDGTASAEKAALKIQAALNGTPQLFEWQHRKLSGEVFDAEVSLNPIDSNEGKFLQAIVRDVTERKESQRALAESEELYRRLISTIPDVIIRTDLRGTILFTNDVDMGIGGYANTKELVGKNIFTFIAPEDAERAKQNARRSLEEQLGSREYRLLFGEGLLVDCEITGGILRDMSGRPYGMVYVVRDIRERKRSEKENKELEEQLLRSQRMESIGTLAGGIAHDLNNVLGPILLVIEILLRRHPDKETQKLLQTVEASARRGSDLVRQVLSFGRGVRGERSVVQVRHLISEIQKIIKETFPKSVYMSSHLPKNLWTVQADPTQVHQVVMNICVNARDAMPRGGNLTISAENAVIDEQYSRMHLEARAGRYVAITMSDTGTGIDTKTLGKIFDPFFTTKEIGKGTGLGLSTVLAIVKSHEGFIEVMSEVEKGTTFKVYFPAIGPEVNDAALDETSVIPGGKGELILVVDDEAGIREITKATLESFGYAVMMASDGTEAVAQYAEKKRNIAAVITDMMMPYMDGEATVRAIQRLNPVARILAVSGIPEYANGITESSNLVRFLQKPYNAEKLLKTLRQLIDES